MAKIIELVPYIVKWEGGLTGDTTDTASKHMCPTPLKGKYYHTNKGVTYRVWVQYFGRSKDDRFLKMSDEDFSLILKKYWDVWRADEIGNQSIANILVDWQWNSGSTGIKKVQGILGVTEDGIVGKNTIKALNNENQKELFDKIFKTRKEFYESIVKRNPSQIKFLKGWMNRLNDYKFY